MLQAFVTPVTVMNPIKAATASTKNKTGHSVASSSAPTTVTPRIKVSTSPIQPQTTTLSPGSQKFLLLAYLYASTFDFSTRLCQLTFVLESVPACQSDLVVILNPVGSAEELKAAVAWVNQLVKELEGRGRVRLAIVRVNGTRHVFIHSLKDARLNDADRLKKLQASVSTSSNASAAVNVAAVVAAAAEELKKNPGNGTIKNVFFVSSRPLSLTEQQSVSVTSKTFEQSKIATKVVQLGDGGVEASGGDAPAEANTTLTIATNMEILIGQEVGDVVKKLCRP
jgi:hypothetical protein